MKTWKRVLIGVGIPVIGVGSMIGYIFIQQASDMDKLNFASIDMKLVKDGSYDGEISTALIEAEIRVEVSQHIIKDITILKHDNGLGGKAETIIKTMKEKNTDDVDTISGATLSSQVIKCAVNQALKKGI